jgi:hypothetical protein
MPIKVSWDNPEKTIVRYQFIGKWDGSDFEVAIEQAFTMTESVSHKVYVIMDMRKGKRAPDGLMLILKRKLAVLPYNRGMIAIADADKAMQTAVKMLMRINHKYNKRIVMVKDLAEARQSLNTVEMMNVLQPETPVFAL